MTPFLLLLAVVATTGANLLYGDDPKAPPYVESLKDLLEVEKNLEKQILSMSPNIPLLNDSRRQYAEITHVIYTMANKVADSCFKLDYDKEYPLVVNSSDPEAIQNPQKVIEETQNLLQEYKKQTEELINMVRDICPSSITDEVCDQVIDNLIKKNESLYKGPAELLIAGGKAAQEFKKLANKFEEVSKNLDAHKYVIQGSKELKNLIYAFADVLRILKGKPC